MAYLKTSRNDPSVSQFIASIDDDTKRRECEEITGLMRDTTGPEPRMWVANIAGIGSYHYKCASGREGDRVLCGFSPRKQNLVLYLIKGFKYFHSALKKLGKYSLGKPCLYFNRLEDADKVLLRELVRA